MHVKRSQGLEEEEEFIPRQSGSLEWRQNRGEMGSRKDGVMDTMAGYKDTDKIQKINIPQKQ